jgi:hypothetical protein
MGPKGKGRKTKGRKGQGRKRKSEWWSENFFAIRDLIWAIYFRVEEPDPAKPSLDDLFRKLRARIDTFEAQCRKKNGSALMARTIGQRRVSTPGRALVTTQGARAARASARRSGIASLESAGRDRRTIREVGKFPVGRLAQPTATNTRHAWIALS